MYRTMQCRQGLLEVKHETNYMKPKSAQKNLPSLDSRGRLPKHFGSLEEGATSEFSSDVESGHDMYVMT